MKKVLVLVSLIGSAFLSGCTSISPGNVGVEISKAGSSRGVQDVAIRTGWVFYNPIWTEVVEYPISAQRVVWTKDANEGHETDESITFTTKNSATVNCDVSMQYQLQEKFVPAFYVKYRADDIQKYTDGILHDIVRNQINDVGGKFDVEDVMGDNVPLLKEAEQAVQQIVSKDGINIGSLGFIGACRPPAAVTNSINAKLAAQQLALQKNNEIAQAEADAKKNEAIAQGDAQANIIRAQADAQANKLRSESLTPQLIQWYAINRWNGTRPQVEGAGSGLIINVK